LGKLGLWKPYCLAVMLQSENHRAITMSMASLIFEIFYHHNSDSHVSYAFSRKFEIFPWRIAKCGKKKSKLLRQSQILKSMIREIEAPRTREKALMTINRLQQIILSLESQLGDIEKRVDIQAGKLMFIDAKALPTSIEIRENGEIHLVELMRNKDGTIWGAFPRKPKSNDLILADGIRNLLILFERGLLTLEELKPKMEV